MKNTPFLLIINDGWGVAPQTRANAITQAATPAFNHLIKNYWVEILQASGDSVGLPWGEMGNSEVGHLSLGSGRIIYQDLPRITRSISDGSFFKNSVFIQGMERAKQTGATLHIAGLLSDGGVHSHIEHMDAILELAAARDVPKIALHCFLDGRDVGFQQAKGFLEDVGHRIEQFKIPARIATISGRYWAMDRDNRWDRTSATYSAMVRGESTKTFDHALHAVDFYYNEQIYDEQIPPTVIRPSAPIQNNDVLIFFNFRSDRMRQIVSSFALPEFNKFDRGAFLKDVHVITMTEYDKGLPATVAFSGEVIATPLAKVLSDAGVSQLHIAETEKYAHVTYFFNGGREEAHPLETRMLIPSPHVADYREVPEMAASEIASRLTREINTGRYGFAVVNFANADMVGHTGDMKATITSIQVLDGCFKELVESVLALDGVVMITADHGNAEVMFDLQTGEINKEHSANPVPCLIIGKRFFQEKEAIPDLSTYIPKGILADVAPTILKIMDIPIPKEMTGRPLI